MKSVIVFPSAFEFWQRISDIKLIKPVNLSSQMVGINQAELISIANEYNLSFPVHIAGSERSILNKSSASFKCHLLPNDLPDNCLFKITDEVYVVSPEYCFIQAARYCSLEVAVAIGNDLCAAYFLDASVQYGLKRRRPLTDLAKLYHFINKSDKVYGIVNARRAIRYVSENSFSPYESKIAAIARLPFSYGGYALPRFKMNHEIKLPAKAAKYLGEKSCCVDFFWDETNVIFEYDSDMTHLESDQHNYDSKRVNALTDAGYDVITGTTGQFRNFQHTDKLFKLIRKRLGLKNRNDRFDKYIEKRYEVFKKLFR